MSPEENENEENENGEEEEVEKSSQPFTQSQIECLNCHQLYNQTTANWLSFCEPCLEKTQAKADGLTCCFKSCESDQHDVCQICKKSFCLHHLPDDNHDCVVQPECNTINSFDDVENLALQPTIDEAYNKALQSDLIAANETTKELFWQRQDLLSSFLKTLTIEETGNYDL